ncbi:MAG: 1-deoxy-D-xylulose-5-phosphate reductoisomerase [Atopobiaceae bacterium]|jgi:1-deoxy-D-xylulose-5-phosphate reductoisomerase|nr:1-deoxy-D-xylulose-5-phosphate reductoisomerase [Atopobiaceae bacterium]
MNIFEDTAPASERRSPLRVAILGCSGSIGTQALDVCRQHPAEIDVVALSVFSSTDKLVSAAREFGVSHVAVASENHGDDGCLARLPKGCSLGIGDEAVVELARLDEVDCVLVALVGAAGIRASHAALAADKICALANKESLVVAGDLLMPLAKPGRLIPVDSEHSAIYQCLVGERRSELHRIWLTCSGGPFYGKSRAELSRMGVRQAMAHPSWSMGPKITIDSATLMNKGLEVIEAHHLFDVPIDDVEVVIHRQSRVHSMVEFCDGTVKADIGVADMRVPIQYALSYPHRWESPCERIDFLAEEPLSFERPDLGTFRCLALALDAGREGGTLPCVMNAANEVANLAFREGRIAFTQVDEVVERVMEASGREGVSSISQLGDVDAASRAAAERIVRGLE